MSLQTSPQSTKILDISSSLSPLEGHSGCEHPRTYWVFTQNDGIPAFCGLCWITQVWEDEIPGRIHAYKLLAENGKPEIAPQFRRHLEILVGLRPPEPGQNLREYRLARGRLYTAPKKRAHPISAALWSIMGDQPPIARCLIRSMFGQPLVEIAVDLRNAYPTITPYGAYQATAKGIRMTLRYLRN